MRELRIAKINKAFLKTKHSTAEAYSKSVYKDIKISARKDKVNKKVRLIKNEISKDG